jgi:phosphonate transport system ATP-binding protein
LNTALKNVSVRLGHGAESRVVLEQVSLQFRAGEQVAIIGPSGAGKTTLLHTLACSIKPEDGELEVLGRQPWSLGKSLLHQLRGQIFLAPQAPPLPPRQRVVNAVMAGKLPQMSIWSAIRSLYTPQDVEAAFAALAHFRVDDKLWLRCDRLSGGERQRVGLARMMVSNAPLILLDEPVSALDPALGSAALKTVQEEAQTRNATLIVSLHDVNLARAQFSRLIGIKAGHVHFDLPAKQITDDRLADLYGNEFETAIGAALPAPGVALPEIETPKAVRCN